MLSSMSMTYRRLGSSGLKVSALSFGAWVTFGHQINRETSKSLLHTAYDAGVNFFDNAEAYAAGQAEVVMGEILHEASWPRDTWTVSSKVFFGAERKGPNQTGLSRKHVIEACHAAMKRLQVDYLDLYYCHRPDPDCSVEETARAMHDLITQGKVLYWGTSEWTGAQLREAFAVCEKYNLQRPTMEQPQYNIFHRHLVEKDYASLYRHPGLGTTIWSPLGGGLLTGKYNQGIPADSRLASEEWLRKLIAEDPRFPQRIEAVKKLAIIAEEIGTTLPRLAIAWCLKNPHVSSVILGASRVEQLEENLKALDAVELMTAEVMGRIEKITQAVAD